MNWLLPGFSHSPQPWALIFIALIHFFVVNITIIYDNVITVMLKIFRSKNNHKMKYHTVSNNHNRDIHPREDTSISFRKSCWSWFTNFSACNATKELLVIVDVVMLLFPSNTQLLILGIELFIIVLLVLFIVSFGVILFSLLCIPFGIHATISKIIKDRCGTIINAII